MNYKRNFRTSNKMFQITAEKGVGNLLEDYQSNFSLKAVSISYNIPIGFLLYNKIKPHMEDRYEHKPFKNGYKSKSHLKYQRNFRAFSKKIER